jgi:hypothetical protein
VPDDVSNPLEQTSSTSPVTGMRRKMTAWPWAWLALAGVATVGWVIGLGWAAVALARWLAD